MSRNFNARFVRRSRIKASITRIEESVTMVVEESLDGSLQGTPSNYKPRDVSAGLRSGRSPAPLSSELPRKLLERKTK